MVKSKGKKTRKTKTKSKVTKKKWGKIGAPHSAERKAHMKRIAAKRKKTGGKK